MGTWLQEAVEEFSRKYKVDATFDVNGWRFLVKGFLSYVEELELTTCNEFNDGDTYITTSLDKIEKLSKDLLGAVNFLRDIQPADKYIYSSKKEKEEIPEEMIAALDADIAKEGLEEDKHNWKPIKTKIERVPKFDLNLELDKNEMREITVLMDDVQAIEINDGKTEPLYNRLPHPHKVKVIYDEYVDPDYVFTFKTTRLKRIEVSYEQEE